MMFCRLWTIRGFATTTKSLLLERLLVGKSAIDVEQVVMKTPLLQFDPAAISQSIALLGKFRSQNKRAVDKLINHLASITQPDLTAEQCAQICFGIATGKLLPQGLPEFLLNREIEQHAQKFSPRDLASVLFSLNFLQHQNERKLIGKLCTSGIDTREDLSDFMVKDFAMILHALSGLQFSRERTLQILGEEIASRDVKEFVHVRDVCYIATSFVALEQPVTRKTMDKLVECAMLQHKNEPQCAIWVLHSMVMFDNRLDDAKRLLEWIALQQDTSFFNSVSPRELGVVCSSFAHFKPYDLAQPFGDRVLLALLNNNLRGVEMNDLIVILQSLEELRFSSSQSEDLFEELNLLIAQRPDLCALLPSET